MSERPPPEHPAEMFVYDPVAPPAREPAERDRPSQAPPPKARPRAGEAPPMKSRKRERNYELIGQVIGGRYRVRGVLGEGGMGTVYDAEHLGLGREVAIKVLNPTQAKKRVAVKRFQQEARAAGAIGHPNICEVYDLGLLDDASPYLVMEKLVGHTLADRIAREGGLPFDDVVEVVVQVLSGLIAAHEKGIVHRDIKPENIFLATRLGGDAVIKLLDFGVSKMMPEFQTGEDFDLTRTGMVMGTPYYMSPEQARGERNLDGRVDVYACGVVMYEALAGKRPFMAPNYNALLLAIINTSPRPLRDLRPKTPPELDAIIARAMSRNRDDRYATAKQFLRELTPPARVGGQPAGVPVPPPTRPSPPSARPSHPAAPPSGRMMPNSREASRHPDGSIAFDATVRGPRPEAPFAVRPVESASESDDSIDIPIHETAPEDETLEDEPTEIIHTGKHRQHAASPRPAERPSSRAVAPSPQLQPIEEWDNDTIVKRPAALSRSDDRPSQRPRTPFNPDETIKLDSKSVELFEEDPSHDGSVPNRRVVPPRRR